MITLQLLISTSFHMCVVALLLEVFCIQYLYVDVSNAVLCYHKKLKSTFVIQIIITIWQKAATKQEKQTTSLQRAHRISVT